jgi:serine/threonine protein phosphatase PrpC
MRVEVYAATRAQQGRTNEDHFTIGRGIFPMYAVADGAGNAQRSAKRATDLFTKLHAETEVSTPAALRHQATWKNWTRLLDTALLGGGQATFCAFTLTGHQDKYSATGVSVGDTRLYLLPSNGNLLHITESAKKSRLGSGHAEPITFHIDLYPGDLLITMTDGAYTPMKATEIAPVAMRAKVKHLSEVPMALIDRAAKFGGLADDATAMVVRVA